MNKNAGLYEQFLTYNEESRPYQCLTLPWFVMTPEPTFPVRHRCEIEPLNCGQRVFSKIATDIRKAKHSVDIITWGFDPGMVLIRNEGSKNERYGELLEKIATRTSNSVAVRILVWHESLATETKMNNNPGFYGPEGWNIGPHLKGFYNDTHREFNENWYDRVFNNQIRNLVFHVRSVPSSSSEKMLKGEEVYDLGASGKIARKFPSHHQKMVLIDYEHPDIAVGYVMGHNSITDYWDTADHIFQDPRRERVYTTDPRKIWEVGGTYGDMGSVHSGRSPSKAQLDAKLRAMEEHLKRNSLILKPYQDVSVRLRGSILYDMNHNFCEGWRNSRAVSRPNDPRGRKVMDVLPDHTFIERRKSLLASSFRLEDGNHSVQLLRTDPLRGEKTIKECYANLTRQFQHYIFIQNQYIQYEPWAQHLMACVQRLRAGGFNKPVYIFLLTSTPEDTGMDLPTYSVTKRIGQSERMTVEHEAAIEEAKKRNRSGPISTQQMAAARIYVFFGSLWTCAKTPTKKSDYEEIYIHAKVAIVDDAAFTLGSANLNLRSMAMDSELNIISQAADIAYNLRCELFEHASTTPGPAQYSDMAFTYQNWLQLAEKNRELKDECKPINGQILQLTVNREPTPPIM